MIIDFKKITIGIALIALALTNCAFDRKGELIEDTYTVKQGDTLWSIASAYIDKNTYGPRDIREFIYGIKELNHDRVFKGREPALIYPGDEIRINYWVKERRDEDSHANKS